MSLCPSRRMALDVARRKDEKCEAAYQHLLFCHYQFYQFYANMPFALAFTYVAWVVSGRPNVTVERAFWLVVLMAFADLVLLLSAKHAIGRYPRYQTIHANGRIAFRRHGQRQTLHRRETRHRMMTTK